MIRFINTIFVLLFITSCGYSPMLAGKDYPFIINDIKVEGNKRKVNSLLINNLKNSISKRDKGEAINKIKYDLEIITNFSRSVISSDSKGDPTTFEQNIEVEVIIFKDGNMLKEVTIKKKNTYNNLEDKFELEKFEDNLIENLCYNIADRIMTILSNV